jgi:hypothetical protein
MAHKHECPCRCGTQVPNALFACRAGWARLPGPLRRRISATAHLPLHEPVRAEAVATAVDWYAHPEAGRRG